MTQKIDLPILEATELSVSKTRTHVKTTIRTVTDTKVILVTEFKKYKAV